jgi:decaprenyl-phosphate phosphoribosyltransferase
VRRVKPWINLIRPTQQIKNGAVLLGAFASGNINSVSISINVLLLALAWVGLSGFSYIINDITDLKTDKNHPEKSKRPIASGQISVLRGATISIFLICLSTLLLISLGKSLFFIGILYILINISYSLYLKNILVIDLLIVSSGFVLRGLSGVLIVNARPSVWFLLLSVFGSLLLVAGKRSAQKREMGEIIRSHRESISLYSSSFLTQIQIMSSTGLIISYVMMSQEKLLTSDTNGLLLNLSILPFLSTILFISYYQDQERETDVTRLLISKKPLSISCATWTLMFILSMAF